MGKKKDYYMMLKPCPKCGSINIVVIHWKTLFFTTRFAIECKKCEYRISGKSERRVVKKWGTQQ